MNELEMREFARKNFVPIVREKTSKLLVQKIKEINPSNILEIGTAIGYSGILMLENSKARLVTLEKDEVMKKIAIENFKQENFSERVELIFGDAFEYIQGKPEKFDFIFLDGPKSQYVKYLPFLLEMLQDNGLLFVDNVLFQGLVKSNMEIPKKHRTIVNNLRKLFETVENDNKIESELLDIEDGVLLIKKRLS